MIPSLPNRDFRSIYLNKKSKKQMKLYKPDGLNSFGRPVKEDGKEEEMKKVENVDRMNSSVVLGGLKVNEKNSESKESEEKKGEKESEESKEKEEEKEVKSKEKIEPVLTLEEKAIQELMKGSREDSSLETKKEIEPILIREQDESLSRSSSDSDEDETSMFRKDVSRRPNPSSLEDYERVPVGSFGLALLKGMGWKEGTSASKNGRLGLLEAIVPKARPSLLGIGAKPLVLDDQGKNGEWNGDRDGKEFVPLIRKVIDPQTGGSDLRTDQASDHHLLRDPSSSRDQSSSRSDEKYKSRYVDEEERSLKDLRIRDDRGGRKERGSDRDEEERRNGRYSEREERSRRDRRDRYDWIDRSGKEERRRGEERESERSRREERDGRGAERSRRDQRDEGERKVGDERRRRDGHEEEEVGMYRKKGRDEEMRYRKSYDDERRRR
ncbi:DExH-box splicing factor binding site-domain-containing protein [Melampsora americana]|nr:DExH-box splicing factor binding site-domain-containing protein [Melampsora americana]